MRLKATIAYDGSRFYGFQRQKTTNATVVGRLENALRTLHIDSAVIGSGRTDRGVHATGQTIHFDIPRYWHLDIEKLHRELDKRLVYIRIKRLESVSANFHARHDAYARRYIYRFSTSVPSPHIQAYIAHYAPGFDIDMLQKALSLFIGTHDFFYFHKSGSNPTTTVRTVFKTEYKHFGKQHIIAVTANGFLRAQVRMMIEAAMQTAYGNLSLKALQKQINAEECFIRTLAPAEGLYLSKVYYP